MISCNKEVGIWAGAEVFLEDMVLGRLYVISEALITLYEAWH